MDEQWISVWTSIFTHNHYKIRTHGCLGRKSRSIRALCVCAPAELADAPIIAQLHKTDYKSIVVPGALSALKLKLKFYTVRFAYVGFPSLTAS